MRSANQVFTGNLQDGISNEKDGDKIIFKNVQRLTEDQGCPLVKKKLCTTAFTYTE